MFPYQRPDGTIIEFARRLENFDKKHALAYHPDTGEVLTRVFTSPQLATSDTRNAARAKVAKAAANDPLYTTLSDYKPKVEALREDYAKRAEANGTKLPTNKIQVAVP